MNELPRYVSDNERMDNTCVLHVCRTGEKEQFYTLYHEGLIKMPYGMSRFCDFQQNLAHSLTDALDKLEKHISKARKKKVTGGFF